MDKIYQQEEEEYQEVMKLELRVTVLESWKQEMSVKMVNRLSD